MSGDGIIVEATSYTNSVNEEYARNRISHSNQVLKLVKKFQDLNEIEYMALLEKYGINYNKI